MNILITPLILLVEDDTIAQLATRSHLEKFNCRVDIAGTAQQALALSTDSYNLILMDVHLGDESGIETVKKIRSTEVNRKHVPIIFLSSESQISLQQDCLNAGGNEFVVKPITQNVLKKLLKKYVLIA